VSLRFISRHIFSISVLLPELSSLLSEVWDFFLGTLLVRYAARHNGVNVVTGPAFDFNHDGRADSREQLQQYDFMFTALGIYIIKVYIIKIGLQTKLHLKTSKNLYKHLKIFKYL